VSRKTESVAARIDAETAARIERAVEQRGETKSALLATIIEDHIDRNPNGVPAFEDRSIANEGVNAGSESTEQSRDFTEQMLDDLE
jgi:predicted DNA-binding protein